MLPVTFAFALLVTSAHAAPRLALSMQPNVPFPVRVYALSLPGDSPPAKIAVTENGRKVDASVVPIGSRATPFSAVVLLDASLTMAGRPFIAARTAAGVLIANKPPRSELALYGFAARPFAVQDFSKNKKKLASFVSSLKIRYGTATWNSVILGSHRLRSRRASARAIVILTDGKRDTTKTPVSAAVKAAQECRSTRLRGYRGTGRSTAAREAEASGRRDRRFRSEGRHDSATAGGIRPGSAYPLSPVPPVLCFAIDETRPGRPRPYPDRPRHSGYALHDSSPAGSPDPEDRIPLYGQGRRGARRRSRSHPDDPSRRSRVPCVVGRPVSRPEALLSRRCSTSGDSGLRAARARRPNHDLP